MNYDELETLTILMIAWSIVAFVLGCMAAGRARQATPSILRIDLPLLEKAIRVLIATNLVGLFFFALRMASTFGISAYVSDPTVIRLNYEDLGRIGALALLLIVNYPLSVCSLIHFCESKRLRWFSVIGLFLSFAQGYVTMSRNSMAIPVATALFAWIYLRGWRTLNRRLLTCLVLILGIIVVYFIGVGAWFGKLASSDTSSYKQQDFNISSQIAMQLVDPYIYSTADFPTLQAAMAEVHGHLWGERTLFPIARLLYALGLLHERPENASLEFYFVPIPSNVATYLFSVYEDFGVVGTVVLPFLLGLVATKVYLRMKEAPSIVCIGGTSAFMVVVLYSVFIALGSTILVWSYLFALYVISKLCTPTNATTSLNESMTVPI